MEKPETAEEAAMVRIECDDWLAGMKLCDRADGVRGRFCIGRHMEEYAHLPTPTWEYWNKGEWCSAGELFLTREAAIQQRIILANVKGDSQSPAKKL